MRCPAAGARKRRGALHRPAGRVGGSERVAPLAGRHGVEGRRRAAGIGSGDSRLRRDHRMRRDRPGHPRVHLGHAVRRMDRGLPGDPGRPCPPGRPSLRVRIRAAGGQGGREKQRAAGEERGAGMEEGSHGRGIYHARLRWRGGPRGASGRVRPPRGRQRRATVRRPVKRLIRKTMIAMTRRMWMRPPAT